MTDVEPEMIIFSPDRAIENPSEDRLHRTSFAEELAKVISAWKGKDSLVIGLTGPWGSGKSSVKNLIKHSLQGDQQKGSPVVVEFVPWQVSGEEKITSLFFEELSRAVGRIDSSADTLSLVKKLRRYQARFRLGIFFLNTLPLRSIRWIVSSIIGLIGFSFWTQNLLGLGWFLVIEAIAALLACLGKIDKWFGTLLEHLEFRSKCDELSLSEIKGELVGLLKKASRPVLMIIDDLDRLMDDEIGLLFRLIKSNADFPNVVYLLLFDRGYVEDALGCLLPKPNTSTNPASRATEYLKKIVQVSFAVPDADQQELEKQVLFKGLDNLFDLSGAGKRFDPERWSMLYPDGLRPFFRTVRDVNRFLSSLSFYVNAFKGEVFNVNPVDLVALEALRVFEGQVYEAIHDRKEYLLHSVSPRRLLQDDDERKEDAKAEIEYLLSLSSPKQRETVKALLLNLFPYVAETLSEYGSGRASDDEYYRQSRICHEGFFDRYFVLNIETHSLTASQVDRVLQEMSKTESFWAITNQYLEAGKISLLLDALDNHKKTLPATSLPAWSPVLMNLLDRLPAADGDPWHMDNATNIARIILLPLHQIADEGERITLLTSGFRGAGSVFFPVYLTHELERLAKEGWGYIGQVFNDSSISSIKMFVGQMLNEISEGKLAFPYRKGLMVLRHWCEWGNAEKAKEWAKANALKEESAIDFLSGFMLTMRSSGTKKIGWRLIVSEVALYVDIEALDAIVSSLKGKRQDPRSELIFKAYDTARERQRSGIVENHMDDAIYLWSSIREL